jgi:uncharacterized membrane protein YkvI
MQEDFEILIAMLWRVLKMYLKEISNGDLTWLHVIQNTDKWLAIMNVVMWLWLLRNAIY